MFSTSLPGYALIHTHADQVPNRGRKPGSLSNRIPGPLRSFTFNASQVPNQNKADRSFGEVIDSERFATGGYSDVRRGNRRPSARRQGLARSRD